MLYLAAFTVLCLMGIWVLWLSMPRKADRQLERETAYAVQALTDPFTEREEAVQRAWTSKERVQHMRRGSSRSHWQ